MLGLAETAWKGPLFTSLLPELCARFAPTLPYVENSPMGGAMPFAPNTGVTHYYGVGAIAPAARGCTPRWRPLCSRMPGFAHVPQQAVLDKHLPVPPVHDPRWKARVPRDRGASGISRISATTTSLLLYDLDPARLRREDRPGTCTCRAQ